MKISLLSLLLFICLLACNDEDKTSDMFLLSTHDVEIKGSTKQGLSFSASVLLQSDITILEEGFVYSLEKDPDFENGVVVSISEPDNKAFSIEMENTLIPDTIYYVKSYLKTEEQIVYGNEVQFYSNGSNPPVLVKLEPDIAYWGDTIMIIGENFDYSGEMNKVYFDELEANEVWGIKDTIYVVVPGELRTKESKVTVNLYGQESDNNKVFEIKTPVIDQIGKSEGQYPDTISINGDYFYKDYCQVLFGEKQLSPIEVTRNEIKFVVPFLGDGQDVNIAISQLDEQVKVLDNFKYNEQVVYGVTDELVYFNEDIFVKAKNIDFRKVQFEILIDDDIVRPYYIKSYNDSISFLPTLGYGYTLELDNEFEFRIIDNEGVVFSNVFSFSFLKPELEVVDPNVSINGYLDVKIEGCTSSNSFKCYYSGVIDTVVQCEVTAINTDITTIALPYRMPPGNYHLYLEDQLSQSNEIEFIIREPENISIEPYFFDKSLESFQILGDYLPKKRYSWTIGWKVRNRLTGFTLDIYGNSDNYFNSQYILGSGVYDLIFEIGSYEKVFENALQFDDVFTYVTTLKEIPSYIVSLRKGIKKGNYLYLYDQGRTTIIDLTSGEIDYHYYGYSNGWWDEPHYFVYNNEIYGIQHGVLKKFNVYNRWEDLIVGNDISVNLAFSVDDELWCVDIGGNIYVKGEGGIFEFFKNVEAFSNSISAVYNDGKIYMFHTSYVEIFERHTLTKIEEIHHNFNFLYTSNSQIAYYQLDNKVLFYSMKYLDFYLFDLSTNEFISSETYKFPQTFPVVFYGEDKEIYLLWKDDVFKFN